MTRKLIASGSPFESTFGYSRAVVQGNWCFVSGTTGYDYASMTMPEGIADQARNAIATLDTNASRESSSTCAARASTARNVFEQCAQRYTDLAGKADGHAADAVMLQDAWPK